MRQVRLLPVVILAAAALFVLKGFGIVADGGYVLTGPSSAQAAGGSAPAPAAQGDDGEATLTLPVEPTMTDASPTLSDEAPTLPLRGGASAAGAHGEPAEDAAGDEAGAHAESAAESDSAHGASADAQVADTEACPVGADFVKQREDCVADPAADVADDAMPPLKDGAGNVVSPTVDGGRTPTETTLLERLAERRDELDTRESELNMRLALLEAAEKRIDERTALLEALEARINAMVDEKRTLEESQFVAIVDMYETMKPKDAAAILDQLDMEVLLRVARAMNPRKMAPIMAKMNPTKAMELTAGMAINQVEPTIELTGEDLTALPRIIGQ